MSYYNHLLCCGAFKVKQSMWTSLTCGLVNRAPSKMRFLGRGLRTGIVTQEGATTKHSNQLTQDRGLVSETLI